MANKKEQDEHPAQTVGLDLSEDDEVIINDRSRPLVVTKRHKRQQTTRSWRARGESKYHTVIELEGNGTEYHLLCTGGSVHGPMLYKGSEINMESTNRLGVSPTYSSGTRVESIKRIKTDGGSYSQELAR